MKDLFGAGVETTNNTIGFIIMYLVMRQDVQRKVHEELDGVLGKEILPRIVYKNRYELDDIAWLVIISLANCSRGCTNENFQSAVLERDDSGSNENGERHSYFDPSSSDG